MKLVYAISLIFITLLTGCISEDTSDCPVTGNITIKFNYPSTKVDDTFMKHIDQVNLFIYNEGGEFVSSKEVSKEELRELQGTTLTLDPGRYSIIGWGNIHNHTGISELNGHKVEDSFLFYSAEDTGDSLYYSPGNRNQSDFILEVPESGSVSGTMDYGYKHKIIEVYVAGFKNIGTAGLTAPNIQITNLLPGYFFDLQPLGQTEKNMKQIGMKVLTPDGEMYLSKFYTPEFKNDNPIQIKIQTSSNSTVYSLSLKDYISEFYPTLILQDGDGKTIRVYLKFENGVVTVFLPDWTGVPVTPIF